MVQTLVIIAHPNLEHSRINAVWAEAARACGSVTVRDLYADYPDGQIDGAHERAMLEAHDRIVLQFPLTWYSCPPLLSDWQIAILKRGWAYGHGGRALRQKTFGIAFSTGSNGRDYTPEGRYGRTLDEITTPFELLAIHTGMHYLPAFTLTGVREKEDSDVAHSARAYIDHLLTATPQIVASGKDDERAKTLYPAD